MNKCLNVTLLKAEEMAVKCTPQTCNYSRNRGNLIRISME